MTTDIILPHNFDINKLSIGDVRPLKSGGKAIYMSYDGGKMLHVQSPEMIAPFGISRFAGENGAPDKYQIDLSLEGREQRASVQALYDMLMAIDNRVLDEAMQNSHAWLKRDNLASREVAEALYTPLVKFSKNKETGKINMRYAPTFKMTLPMRDNRFICHAFGADRQELDIFDLVEKQRTQRARVKAIFRVSNVWIVSNKFGVTLKAQQLVVIEQITLSGYAFQRTDEDADDDRSGNGIASITAAAASARTPAVADDDGNDSAAAKLAARVANQLHVDSSDDDQSYSVRL